MQRAYTEVGLVTALFALACYLPAQSATVPELPLQQHPLIIRSISVIDVASGEVHTQNVSIDRGRIVDTNGRSGFPSSQGAIEIDGRGKFLIPGLWDAHVHVAEETGRFLPLYLRFGMTSLIDKGGPLDKLLAIRSAVISGQETGPRLFMAGQPLDGDPPQWPSAYPDVPLRVRNGAEARLAVRSNKEAGANYIKLYGGLGREAMSAAISEAHQLGLKTTGDLLGWSLAVEVALTLGIDGLEHGIPTAFKTGAPGSYSWEAEESRVQSLLQIMNSQHAALTSTITHMVPFRGRAEEKATFQALPPQLQKRAREMLTLRNLSTPFVARMRDYWCRSVGRFAQQGGLVMAGTDSFWSISYPGDVHEELQQLVACGLSPLQALQAVTLNPAQWLALNDLGTVKIGNRADLVILQANPLVAIENTQRIAGVVLGGRYFDQPALEALSELASQPLPKP